MTLAVWPSMGLPLSFRHFFKELSWLGGMTEDKQSCHLSSEQETLAIESSVQLNQYHRAVPADGFSSSRFSEAEHFPWEAVKTSCLLSPPLLMLYFPHLLNEPQMVPHLQWFLLQCFGFTKCKSPMCAVEAELWSLISSWAGGMMLSRDAGQRYWAMAPS